MIQTNEIIGALDRNDEAGLQRLVEQGRDLNLPDAAGRTALMYAALAGKVKFLQLLIADKADLDRKDKAGMTALHFAAQDQQLQAVEALCNAGATVDAEDQFGNTPLWKAVFSSRGKGEVITALLKHGAEPDRKNKAGRTPKMLAETIGNYDVKRFFR